MIAKSAIQTAVRTGGGEFSSGTMGNFHPALTEVAVFR